MSHIFFEITLILVLATAMGVVAHKLRQPAILGYLAAGLLVGGPLGLLKLTSVDAIDAMAEFGIAFLLFLVGMEIDLTELKQVGRNVILIGLGQVFFTTAVGLIISVGLGFGFLSALYIAVPLTFSSTIIVVKLLSEKKAIDSLYGRISIGILLVQDFVALGILILLSGLKTAGAITVANFPWDILVFAFAKGTIFLLLALALGKWVVPRLFSFVGHSPELLFLVSLAWGLGFAALVALPKVGLTVEIGSFLAGIALAHTVERYQISSRVRALRDFFLVMFFIVLGSKVALSRAAGLWLPTAALTTFVLIGNPLIVMALMGLRGYRARTSFMVGGTMAMVSEFSLIVVTLGKKVGHIGDDVVGVVTAVSILSIIISSYLIQHSELIWHRTRRLMKIFERRGTPAESAEQTQNLTGHIVLIGCHRLGHSILESLTHLKKDFLVIDFNPDVVKKLHARGVRALYGDAADPEIMERAGLDRAKMIISTAPTITDSGHLLRHVRRLNPSAKIILTAEDEHGATSLYEAGADYVMLPHFIGGIEIAHALQDGAASSSLKALKERDLHAIMNQT